MVGAGLQLVLRIANDGLPFSEIKRLMTALSPLLVEPDGDPLSLPSVSTFLISSFPRIALKIFCCQSRRESAQLSDIFVRLTSSLAGSPIFLASILQEDGPQVSDIEVPGGAYIIADHSGVLWKTTMSGTSGLRHIRNHSRPGSRFDGSDRRSRVAAPAESISRSLSHVHHECGPEAREAGAAGAAHARIDDAKRSAAEQPLGKRL